MHEIDASVVMPAWNDADTLPDQLEALGRQDFSGRWELIVVDNGSRDGTAAIVKDWQERLPSLRLVDASDVRGAAYARNRGAADAQGEFLLFCDADDVVAPDWMSMLVEAADDADAVGGRRDFLTLNSADARYWRNVGDEPLPARGDSLFPVASTANLCVRRKAFEELGGFDENLARAGGEDTDLCFRLQLAGYRLAFSDDAIVACRLASTVKGVARQSFRYSRGTAYVYRRFAALGMPRRRPGLALKSWAWLALNSWRLVSRRERGRWMWVAGSNAGRLAGSVRYRVLYL